MMTPKRRFVLVADASRARLFKRDEERPDKLVLAWDMEHPPSRAKNRDLMADKPGRAHSSSIGDGASGMAYRTEPKQVEAEKFARELGNRLAHEHDAHTYDELVIAAPPKFLGLLRQTLATHDNHVEDCVATWIEKDYSWLPEHDLEERFRSMAA